MGGNGNRLSSGIQGLDEVLEGGFIPGQSYLVRGGPGTGKTILGLHFLCSGTSRGEKALLITLMEQEDQIRKNAEALGLNLQDVAFLDMSPTSKVFTNQESYDIFSPAEVEREPLTSKIVENLEKLKPQRVFIDSMTQLRYLSPDAFQFRRQVLSLQRFFLEHGATILFSSEASVEAPDADMVFLSDAVIEVLQTPERRGLKVTKFRGSGFRSGVHSVKMTSQGMLVFPKLMPDTDRREFAPETIPSGVPELDQLLAGGLEQRHHLHHRRAHRRGQNHPGSAIHEGSRGPRRALGGLWVRGGGGNPEAPLQVHQYPG